MSVLVWIVLALVAGGFVAGLLGGGRAPDGDEADADWEEMNAGMVAGDQWDKRSNIP